jgi:hypothetical protein
VPRAGEAAPGVGHPSTQFATTLQATVVVELELSCTPCLPYRCQIRSPARGLCALEAPCWATQQALAAQDLQHRSRVAMQHVEQELAAAQEHLHVLATRKQCAMCFIDEVFQCVWRMVLAFCKDMWT